MTDNSNLTNQIIELKELIEQQQTTLDNREAFIDWVMENHPVVIKQYLGWGGQE